MKVLSLFDGMSSGQIALKKLGIVPELYFAAEIDKHAIKVTKKNFPNTIHVGGVENVTAELMCKHNIDLLLGGSPCQSFSRHGDGSGFDGKSGLFGEFVRVLKEVRPTYFLFENVVMKQEWQDVISQELGVLPMKINSALVSGQNRERLYWTNIPYIDQPADREIMLADVVEPKFSSDYPNYLDLQWSGKTRKSKCKYITDDKAHCLTATMWKGNYSSFIQGYDGGIHRLTAEDCERLQTVPEGYTNHVANMHRLTMLGNGWTVDIIAYILAHLPEYSIPIYELEVVQEAGTISNELLVAMDEGMFELLGENGFHDLNHEDISFFLPTEKGFLEYPDRYINGMYISNWEKL